MIHFGKDAIAAFEKDMGRQASAIERRLCYLEAYADEPYLDSKKIVTDKMGLTGEWITKGMQAALDDHMVRLMNRLPEYHNYPDYLQIELFQAEWRGDLGHSPKACKMMNARQFEAAAVEFLDHDEFRTGPQQIRDRILAVSRALSLHGLTREL